MADLTWADELYELALEHSINMADTDTLSHDGFSDRFDRVEMCTWSGVAENVAYNWQTGDEALEGAVTQWAESTSGHRENQLGDFEYTACAAVSIEETGKVYFTTKFMNCF